MAIVLTNTAKYDPFTFQELAAPYALIDKAAGEVMDTIDELGSKAELLKKYADEDPNSEYAKQYNQYIRDLDKVASDMSRYGMSATLRDNSRSLKRRYSSAVSPMEEADKLFKEQQKERLAHPERMYIKDLTFADAYNNSIDNTYTTEKDITNEALLNYSPGFITSYTKYRDAKYSPDSAMNKAREDNQTSLNSFIDKLKLQGYNTDDSRVQKAIYTAMKGAEIEAAKNEVMTRSQRETLAMQKQKAYEERQERKATYFRQGLDENGSVSLDANNPYWRGKGFKLNEAGNAWIVDPDFKKSNRSNSSASTSSSSNQVSYSAAIAWKDGVYISNSSVNNINIPNGAPVQVIANEGNNYTVRSKGKVVADFTVGANGEVVISNQSKEYNKDTIDNLIFTILDEKDKNSEGLQAVHIILGKNEFKVTPRSRGKGIKEDHNSEFIEINPEEYGNE